MTTSHVTTGGIPAALIAALVAALSHSRVQLTTDEAVMYGGLATAFGTALAHRISRYGIRGLFTGLWRGTDPTN